MNDLEALSKIGTDAVKRLRKEHLAAGKTFMINSKDLPSTQAYLEYPDGSISIVMVAPNQRSFDTVCKLSDAEAQAVRRRFNLV
jgi:hypothetical protein